MKFAKKLVLIVVLCAAMLIPSVSAQAAVGNTKSAYSGKDAFAHATTKKGIQGNGSSESYCSQNTLYNTKINDWVGKPGESGVTAYEYKGKTYYFKPVMWLLREISAVSHKRSISVVFLLDWNSNQLELIDPASRVAGKKYYAPSTDGYIEALFSYITETCASGGRDCRIDNFILGNEVNMPNSWHYSGSTDPKTCAYKYADAFYQMYQGVRNYSDNARCSISLDHSWQHNDEGRGIMAKQFLDLFAQRLAQYSPDVDWCVSLHLYPAILFETDIWATNGHIVAVDLNPKSTAAQFVDGNNLSIVTNYIRDTYGEQHRVMLTEQGFSDYMGDAYQAASLAYTYYAAKFDPMVDCFTLVNGYHGDKLNFTIDGKLAGEVYERIDTGKPEDIQWINQNILPIIGVSSWAAIVPNYTEEIPAPTAGIQVENVTKDLVTVSMDTTLQGDLEYSWYVTYDNMTYEEVCAWNRSANYFVFRPSRSGSFTMVGKVRNYGDESTELFTAAPVEYHGYIKGKCQMPYTGEGGGYLIGIESYDNPNQSYTYEMLILDCTLLAQGKDAWTYTTGRCGVSEGNALWTIWQPQYGYYWTLFRVYDADGNMLDEACYGFANAY